MQFVFGGTGLGGGGRGVRKVHYGLCEHGKFITLQISFCIVRLPYFVIFITFTFFLPFYFRDGGGAALLRHRNRAATTVFMCEQKPNPI